jgi:hypothetical protein
MQADGRLFAEEDKSAVPLFSNGVLRSKARLNEKNASAFVICSDLSTLSAYVMGWRASRSTRPFVLVTKNLRKGRRKSIIDRWVHCL